jgi:ATP-dependent Clp protease ATP-binding subunit ClpC
MFQRYTEPARRVIFVARIEAGRHGSKEILVAHLLLGILREARDFVQPLVGDDGFASATKAVEDSVAAASHGQAVADSADMALSHAAKRVLAYGAEEAERLRAVHIEPAHLLLGVLREGPSGEAIDLRPFGLTKEGVRKHAGTRPAADPNRLRQNLHRAVDEISQTRLSAAARILGALCDERFEVFGNDSQGGFRFTSSPDISNPGA